MLCMKEEHIRPKEIHDKYIELSKKDADTFFPINKKRIQINCPACNSNETNFIFQKYNFHYELCNECGTLFNSPRPSLEDFKIFYEDSPSSNYWSDVFFPSVEKIRIKELIRPKALKIFEYFSVKEKKVNSIVDVGSGKGTFLEEWQKISNDTDLYAVEPSKKMSEICRDKGINTLENIVEEASEFHGIADLAVSFETIEHVQDPLLFVSSIRKLLKEGGYMLMTGICYDGFDIQTLGINSKTISPPFHINFMSLKGYQLLLKRAGFSEIEVITPGILDFDIVLNSLNHVEPQMKNFVELINARGEDVAKMFQQFLINAKLSSHAWIIAK